MITITSYIFVLFCIILFSIYMGHLLSDDISKLINFDYKITHIDDSMLILTKGPFNKREYVYRRDWFSSMPWVTLDGDRPNQYSLEKAIKKYKNK